jgi:hypothetical protein
MKRLTRCVRLAAAWAVRAGCDVPVLAGEVAVLSPAGEVAVLSPAGEVAVLGMLRSTASGARTGGAGTVASHSLNPPR